MAVPDTLAESEAGFEERARLIAWSQALLPLVSGDAPDPGHRLSPTRAEARFQTGFEIAKTNRAILDRRVRPWAAPGTDFRTPVPFCGRKGDYDFWLRAWIPVLYRYWRRPDRLWPQTRYKILHELMTVRGGNPVVRRLICGVPIPETENHILMTEGSRYLTNQLLNRERRERGLAPAPQYDNAANGMTTWLLRHLSVFLRKDFSEFNSKPYQPYTVMALQNLYEFAEDARVRTMARGVLDYISAKSVIASNELRRWAPMRRQRPYLSRTELFSNDGEMRRLMGVTGQARHLGELSPAWVWSSGLDLAYPAVTGRYRVPSLLLDLVFRKNQSTFERIRHAGIEIYARSPEFLISGGGVYNSMMGLPWIADHDGFAVPTTLLPTGGSIRLEHLIRFGGHRKTTRKGNTCVLPGFACGLNPVIPASIPASCRRVAGAWTFIDFQARGCPFGYPLYVAMYRSACDTDDCRDAASGFGFLEAVSAGGGLRFEDFARGVLARNGRRGYGSQASNTYVMHDGRTIRFQPLSDSRWIWPIISVDGRPVERRLKQWRHASGRILSSDGRGMVWITNPWMRKRIVIDVRDPLRPRRTESSI